MTEEKGHLFETDLQKPIDERMELEYGETRATDEPFSIRRKVSFEVKEEIKPEYGPGEIKGPDDIPSAEYKEHLINLLEMQADSELAGALGYVPCIRYAPTVEEYLAAAMITKDEFRHARVCYKLLEYLGEDVDARMHQHDFTLRLDADDANIGTTRIAADKRVNIFYYPIPTWTDFIMFQFCMDRGAGHQLEDSLESSYRPWAKVMEGIFKEEMFHIAHGDSWVKRLAQDPKTHDEVQAALSKWFPRTMNIFGRPGSRRNKIYRRLGLKKRDNHEVRMAFANEVQQRCEEFGLDMPKWTPDWEKLPEEAVVVG